MLKVVTAPNNVLSEIAKEIPRVDKHVSSLIEQMKETLASQLDPEGVGLAAPQVGRSVRLFITRPTPSVPVKVFINPVILDTIIDDPKPETKTKVKKTSVKLEGCLSLPTIWGEVKRFNVIKISYMDETGKTQEKIFRGFMATIIQHEIDHLEGILFPKRVLEQGGTLYKSHKDEKHEDIFEQIEI